MKPSRRRTRCVFFSRYTRSGTSLDSVCCVFFIILNPNHVYRYIYRYIPYFLMWFDFFVAHKWLLLLPTPGGLGEVCPRCFEPHEYFFSRLIIASTPDHESQPHTPAQIIIRSTPIHDPLPIATPQAALRAQAVEVRRMERSRPAAKGSEFHC